MEAIQIRIEVCGRNAEPTKGERKYTVTLDPTVPDAQDKIDTHSVARLESLTQVIGHLHQEITFLIARHLASETVPIDPRFAQLIGTTEEPLRDELAERLAAYLDLPQPTRPETVSLLVNLATAAHLFYDPMRQRPEEAEVGDLLTKLAMQGLAVAELVVCAADLGVVEEDPDHLDRPQATEACTRLDKRLWDLSTRLVSDMGIEVW